MARDDLYESPKTETVMQPHAKADGQSSENTYSAAYNPAFRTALLIQAILAVLSVLVLDHGQTHRAFWVAFLAQWTMVWIILFRRSLQPTGMDLAFVRYGILPIGIIVAAGGPWLLRALGLH